MAGTVEGGLKTASINTAGDPDFYRKLGHKGGIAPYKGLKGFAANRELASIVGRLGVLKSRRGKATTSRYNEKVTCKTNESKDSHASDSTTRVRLSRCADCRQLTVTSNLDDMGLCKDCPRRVAHTEAVHAFEGF